MRVALLSYRSKPHCGGQGIYLRHVSRELTALGHSVEVFSGQPYPELEPGPRLRVVPSLDLYRDDDPFRTPRPGEFRDWIDALEVGMMWTAAFPEPLTFSLRALRALRARKDDFDIVHDNQVLAYGMLGIRRLGLPLVTSIHHPISVDRRIELAQARGLQRLSKRRWYSFVRMQARVARRVGPVMTGSQSSRDDIIRDFAVAQENVRVIPLGVDTRLFHPRPAPRIPGSMVAVASADSPVKGIPTLLRAFAKISTERDALLTVVGKPMPGGPTEQLIGELSLGDKVRFVTGISDAELAELVASAEIAVVPSLYEGFSLPAVEHMASGTPLVASRTGALPEVTGDAAVLVRPGDPEELAATLRRLQDSPRERELLSAAALRRVQERFAWPTVARATVAEYRSVIARAAARATAGAGGQHPLPGSGAAPGHGGDPTGGAQPGLRARQTASDDGAADADR
ncbi:MAG TPA: glycosyltransferase family 4 protein [Streptosporangiaceae bacterium]|nr:glycosyltransferase family 4 protein [Streptosporangiaceae bacterium]